LKENFDKAFLETLKHEGGLVNHPRDPGGMTNLGVTKRVWEDYTGRQASETDMRALTPEKVKPLYRERYWDRVRGDDLPSGVDFAIYDFAVNSGPARAVRFAQKIAGATQDGAMGPKTLAKIKEYCDAKGDEAFIQAYTDARMDFLQGLSTFNTFGRGWTRRVNDVEHYASVMSRTEVA
jgi:lysozyme family protein